MSSAAERPGWPDRRAPNDVGARRSRIGSVRQVFMMFMPTLRVLTGPLPPGAFAARFLAAVIRPPLLFLVTRTIPYMGERTV